jgi:cytochrome c-type biogenesis protein CcmF
MISEIGHFALILAWITALFQMLSPIGRGRARFILLADHAARLQLLLVVAAMTALMVGFLRSDFSLLLVVGNSHSAKPLLYKLGGVWGNHEGSLLLWILMLSAFGAAVSLFRRSLPDVLRQTVLAVMGTIGFGFLALSIFTSNPFARLDPAPFEGQDLNPLLQDPGLVFHPPVLYAGYVGFSVAFAFAIAALCHGRVDAVWARWVRPWVLMAWIFLTIGITMGSWWAYYELGWGGWWFWDPVENASLMPWMTGTALLHSVLVVERRGALKTWTVFLAILTFSLSLLGTFLVRSGVLTSVHAFATDPQRGLAILILLGGAIGGAFSLFAWKGAILTPEGAFAPISRETGLILNNLFLICAAATILVGVLFPIVNDLLKAPSVSVGAPFFEATVLPLLSPLVFLLGVGPLIAWRKADLAGLFQRLRVALIITGLAGMAFLIFTNNRSILAVIGLVGAVWILASCVTDLVERAGGVRHLSIRRVMGLSGRFWGRFLGHAGFGVFLLGATGTNVFQQELMVMAKPGQQFSLAGFDISFDSVATVQGPNYRAEQAIFTLQKDNQKIAIITPEKRHYLVNNVETTEAGIHTDAAGDLFITVGDPQDNQNRLVRMVRHPLVPWIWIGGWIMAAGGMMAAMARRQT